MGSYFDNISSNNNIPKLAYYQEVQLELFKKKDPNRHIKLGIWAYFLLLIFEGALRKWFLPGLATPLLIIRDPLALWLVIVTWRRGLLPSTIYLIGMVLIGICGTLTTLVTGHGNLWVTVFGARILLLHFPLIFVIGKVFTREDVVKMSKVTLLISIPMALLVALQFYSPQTSWVNRGVGGNIDGAGFSGAMGFFRPPGTFSFTNGTTLFFSFLSFNLFYFWLKPEGVNRVILLAATVALLMAIPLSISRSLLFQVGISFVFAAIVISRKPKYLKRMMIAIMGGVIVVVFLSQTRYFKTASEVFSTRFEVANKTEGGLEGVLLDRYLGGLIGALIDSAEMPFFGYGLGMGTNVGSKILTGDISYLIAEGEWGRLVGELGPLMGIAVIFLRLSLCIKMAFACYQKMLIGDLLPWMLLGFGLLTIPQSQWGQPTSLGFSTLIGGLILASLRVIKIDSQTPRNYSSLKTYE